MNNKTNPFQPNSPTPAGMFHGRIPEIEAIERTMLQTKAGESQSFLLLGERGMGKTSLLRVIKWIAEGLLTVRGGGSLNFLVVETDITKDTTQATLIRKIEMALSRKLADTETARAAFHKGWSFLKKFEVAGVSYKETSPTDRELLCEEFAYSLGDTLKRISGDKQHKLFSADYDGVLVLVDEADNASADLDLGTFVKLTIERLQRSGAGNLMFGFAGLPKTKDVLYESHPSSLRVFEELMLEPLSDEEVRSVIHAALGTRCAKLNGSTARIEDEAVQTLVEYTEGLPHFIQQYGFSAFEASDGEVIKLQDVLLGSYGETGALQSIGNKYYRQDYYGKISTDSYREVLKIMADSMDAWVTKQQIRNVFTGNDQTLTNAIHALQKRKIIITKDGVKGVYRLRDKGFAKWIKLDSQKP